MGSCIYNDSEDKQHFLVFVNLHSKRWKCFPLSRLIQKRPLISWDNSGLSMAFQTTSVWDHPSFAWRGLCEFCVAHLSPSLLFTYTNNMCFLYESIIILNDSTPMENIHNNILCRYITIYWIIHKELLLFLYWKTWQYSCLIYVLNILWTSNIFNYLTYSRAQKFTYTLQNLQNVNN